MGRLNDYREGSTGRENQHEIKFVDKQVTHSELRKSYLTKKSRGTPMKMLIAQEMRKETVSSKEQPNVVARLMGLDDVPSHKNYKPAEYNYLEKSRKDVFDVWQERPRANSLKSLSVGKELYMDIQNDMRMALVREKFMEAKRLAKSDKLLESKEFLNAVEVLSSNRDLFLKCLEGPNSLFSKQFEEPKSSRTSTISMLKPSKSSYGKQSFPVKQPTRIVILKPNPLNQNKASNYDFDHFSDGVASTKSVHKTNGSAHHMKEKHSSRRDESLLSSSALSSGYVGDESSFNRSEIESKLSDSNTSRHSSDYSNRFGSPYSSSSYSRVFSSPEPSVIREAKKRLSERLSMLASSVNEEQSRKSLGTIGEMLANREVEVGRSFECEDHFHTATSQDSSSICQSMVPNINLSRSRSVPLSSDYGLNWDDDSSQAKKTSVTRKIKELKFLKLSFKSKLSSMFSPKSKKDGRNRSVTSTRMNSIEFSGEVNDQTLNSFAISGSESCHPVSSEEESTYAPSPASAITKPKQDGSFTEANCLEKPSTTSEISESQNEPSPTSILLASFESDISNDTSFSEPLDSKDSTTQADTNAHTSSWGGTSFEASLSDTSDDTSFFVHTILSASGLESKKLIDIFTNRFSVRSPLDPDLLNEYQETKDDYDNNSWEMHSNKKFIFDCINYALIEMSGYAFSSAYRCSNRVCCANRPRFKVDALIVDEVWLLINSWISNEHCEIEDYGMIVDRLLRNEVNGCRWSDLMHYEVDEMITKMSEEVLSELIAELF